MPFLTVGTNNDDLTLQVPAKRTTDWANEFLDNFVRRIVDHDHSGNGRGKQLTTMALADNSVTSSQILLSDGTALQWQDTSTGNAVDIISYTQAEGKVTIEEDVNLTTGVICTNAETTVVGGGLFDTGIESVDGRIINYTAETIDTTSGVGTGQFQVGTIFIDSANFSTHEFSVGTSNFFDINGYIGASNTLHLSSNLSSLVNIRIKYITFEF